MLITQEGYYFGVIQSSGFGNSPGGLPQETLDLQAQQIYDPDGGEYVLVDPAAGTDIRWYGALISHAGKLIKLNCQQLSKVTGWSGADLVELQKADYSGMPIQFRVETKIWDEKPRLEVTRIDKKGAAPFKSVPKCSLEDAQALQARYAGVLTANKPPAAAVSAPAKAADKPAAAAPSKRKRRTKAEIAAEKAAAEATPADQIEEMLGDEPKPPFDAEPPATTTPAKRPTMPKPAVVGKCTADGAWKALEVAKRDDITADQLADAWFAAIKLHAPGGDEAQATDETWFLVRRDVLASTGKI